MNIGWCIYNCAMSHGIILIQTLGFQWISGVPYCVIFMCFLLALQGQQQTVPLILLLVCWINVVWVDGESGFKSAFSLARSYHRLQVGYGAVCRCVCGEWIFRPDLFASNDLRPAVFFFFFFFLLVASYRLNSTTGEQKGIIQTIILNPSWPDGCLTQ